MDTKSPPRISAVTPPPKGQKNAVAHVWGAFLYSMAGFRFLMEQRAARLQFGMALIAVVIFLLSGVSLFHWVIMGALLLTGLCVEALNTAIELIVDRTSPEISDYAMHAKDLGSFAVFCTMVVFWGHVGWAVFLA